MTDPLTRTLADRLHTIREAGRTATEPDVVDETVQDLIAEHADTTAVVAAEPPGIVGSQGLTGGIPLLRLPPSARLIICPADESQHPALIGVPTAHERVRTRWALPPVPPEWAEVHFDAVPVTRLDLPGELAERLLAVLLLSRATYLWGLAMGAIELAMARCRERRQFGVPIGANQALALPIAAHHARLAAAEALLDDVAASASTGEAGAWQHAAAGIAHTARLARDVTAYGLHLHGAHGLTAASRAQRYYLYALLNAPRPEILPAQTKGSDRP